MSRTAQLVTIGGLSLVISACTADPANQEASWIRYEEVSSDPSVGVAFSYHKRQMREYNVGHFDEDTILDSDLGGSFEIKFDGQLFSDEFGLSIPKHIEPNSSWRFGDAKCIAESTGIFRSSYVVACTSLDGRGTFGFSPHRGIEWFEYECGTIPRCRLKPISNVGIFGPVARERAEKEYVSSRPVAR